MARAAVTFRRRSIRRALAAALAAVATGALAADELRNWFDDPFFQISSAVPDCPLPAGPFVSESDKRVQAHRRAEKGTTCWLAKECDRPNAYAYDQDIAASLRQAAPGHPALAGTTLWATVQGRVVYVEGCAPDDAAVARIESFVRAIPHVQQALAIVRTDPAARPPYKVRPSS